MTHCHCPLLDMKRPHNLLALPLPFLRALFPLVSSCPGNSMILADCLNVNRASQTIALLHWISHHNIDKILVTFSPFCLLEKERF